MSTVPAAVDNRPAPSLSRGWWEIDWVRLGRRALIGSVMALTAVVLWKRTQGPQFGFDFYGGAWKAAHAILHGRSPYVRPDSHLLFALRNAFVTPPLLGIIAIPYSFLPFKLAVSLWAFTCSAAFAGALYLVGLREKRLYALAMCSFPFADSILMGQSDCLLMLGVAAAWRYRSSWRGGVAVGAVVAAKLFAWPLVLWLVVTRRFRSALAATASACILTLATWGVIGYQGLAGYPRLLAADARAFEGWVYSNSAIGGAMHFGLSAGAAAWIAGLLAVGVAATAAVIARGSDRGWFAAAITFGLLASPILWPHYLVVLLVPLAVSKRESIAPWAAYAVLWIGLFNVPPQVRTPIILAAVIASTLWASSGTSSPGAAISGIPRLASA